MKAGSRHGGDSQGSRSDNIMKENIDPKMHTAEHILNQTMVRLFNSGRCFSAHIEKKKSKCDYRYGRALSEDEIKNLENKINEIIKADMPVIEKFVTETEAQNLYTLYDLGDLPDNNSEKYRMIAIGDYDAIPCYGAHVNSTGELGELRIVSVSFENGVLRIRYKLN